MSALPKYLSKPDLKAEVTYGQLSYQDGERKLWVIEGEPQVAQMAKRLFPGSEGLGQGVAKFPATKRAFGDLVWLMHRWPLSVEPGDLKRWRKAYRESCQFTRARDQFNQKPTSVLPAPTFRGTLRPYQKECLAWTLANPRTLIADEMGIGKTVEALAHLATFAKWPALIVVPPHLLTQWNEVIPTFLDVSRDPGSLFDSQSGLCIHTITGRKNYELPPAHIYLCHYLLLASWQDTLLDINPKAIVYEECQELRRRESLKYSAASLLSEQAESVIGLSGTPIYNRGGEIWNVLNAIEMHALGDWDSFTREWCNGYGSDVVRKPAMLGAHLKREGLMIRRRKEDVLKDLPPKSRVVHHLDHDEDAFSTLLAEAVSLAVGALSEKHPLKRGREERAALEETRRATGLAKVKPSAAFIRSLVESGESVVVFAHHHDVVDGLLDCLQDISVVVISGRQSPAQKAAAKESFIAGIASVCLISLRAAAGIDGLQRASQTSVFVELDWSPAVHSQGEDRLHRDDQKGSVTSYYLVINDGTDPDVQEALGLKVSQATQIMGDEFEQKEVTELRAAKHMKAVLTRLRRKARASGTVQAA